MMTARDRLRAGRRFRLQYAAKLHTVAYEKRTLSTMTENRYIDITPLAQSRERAKNTGAVGDGWRTRKAAALPSSKKQSSRVVDAAQVLVGGACALVGIPLLVLPGPGILAIAAGVALMANGCRKLFGKSEGGQAGR
jgi:hypothetical protein